MTKEARHALTALLLAASLVRAQLAANPLATRFASHVSVRTPARSFTHGVGDPIGAGARGPRLYPHPLFRNADAMESAVTSGYRRERPAVPFYQDAAAPSPPPANSLSYPPWPNNILKTGTIPVLPPSPYRINSPNPESLWPEGLFVPPSGPLRGFDVGNVQFIGKKDDFLLAPGGDSREPYFLRDAHMLQVLDGARRQGELFFHDIPHHRSLLENQQMRINNRLEPHRLGSIRHTWIYFRP